MRLEESAFSLIDLTSLYARRYVRARIAFTIWRSRREQVSESKQGSSESSHPGTSGPSSSLLRAFKPLTREGGREREEEERKGVSEWTYVRTSYWSTLYASLQLSFLRISEQEPLPLSSAPVLRKRSEPRQDDFTLYETFSRFRHCSFARDRSSLILERTSRWKCHWPRT